MKNLINHINIFCKRHINAIVDSVLSLLCFEGITIAGTLFEYAFMGIRLPFDLSDINPILASSFIVINAIIVVIALIMDAHYTKSNNNSSTSQNVKTNNTNKIDDKK